MNSIQLIGRLTADPELRFTNGGTATCTIRLAVPRRRTKGEAEPAPVFVNVVTSGNQAEAVAEHMAKGRRVSVTGRLEYREWTTPQGRVAPLLVRTSGPEVGRPELQLNLRPDRPPAGAGGLSTCNGPKS